LARQIENPEIKAAAGVGGVVEEGPEEVGAERGEGKGVN
jgi:hypothetical protein